ncbi:MAG: hypothetical protein QOG62_2416, partial [Thermoleophilaceae bacterium]|nr:hypothetical protein [Thermoleophilaceae bacterium]
GTITAVAAGTSDERVLYAGTDDGRLWTSKDLGGTWTRMSDPDLPATWVTRVAVDSRDAAVAYASFSGFRNGADTAHLVRTKDGGVTWDNISVGLPSAPVNDVVLIGDDLVVATDVGVFLSRNAGASWLQLGANLPLAPVLDVRYHAPTGTLTAATFGRSVWRIDYPEG